MASRSRSSRSSGDGDDEDTEEEEEGEEEEGEGEADALIATPRSSRSSQKVAAAFASVGGVHALVAELKDRVLAASVKDLRRSYFFGTLALWHTYGVWLAACVDLGVALVLLVRWYVGWLGFSMHTCGSGGSAFGASCVFRFFATFFRAYLLIMFVSEMARFCLWLARDAWRDDAFEAYRRTLLGQARAEMELGALYSVGWSSKMLKRRLRHVDAALQWAIFASFDVVPLVSGAVAYAEPGTSPGTAAVVVFQALAIVSVVHVLLFFAAWTATDIRLKVIGFKQALKGRRDFTLDARDLLTENMEEELRRAKATCDEQDALLLESAFSRHAGEALRRSVAEGDSLVDSGDFTASARGAPAAGAPGTRRSVADRLNVCAPVRELCHIGAPHLLWPSMILCGAVTGQLAVLATGLMLAPLVPLYTYAKTHHSRRALRSLPRVGAALVGESKQMWALQAWGETCCGLHPPEQLKRRLSFTKIVLFQSILFMCMGWWVYVVICFFFLIAAVVKQMCLFSERPLGWLVGIVESVFLAALTVLLCWTFPTTPSWKSGAPSIGIFFLAAGRQFGLARANPDCYRLMHAVSLALTFATLLIVGVVLYSSMTYDSMADFTKGTAFCNPHDPKCRYYTVPYRPPNETHGLTCPAWFSVGSKGQHFSLSDFALLSWIAYEPRQTMAKALQHYFPGWRVVHAHWAAASADSAHGHDWTNFFEYESGDGQTCVFAIRGTHSAIDALNDIILWTPAVVFQAFSFAGPNLAPAVQTAVASIVSFFEGHHRYDVFFEELLRYVERRKLEEPERECFITGHSLGGGLAKLVAAKVGLRAVTFMAPGLSTTSHVVYRSFSGDILRGNEVLTLQPSNDIVSRLDEQTGLVVPIHCSKASGLYCHLLGPALCEMYDQCGSGLPGRVITLPCGACDRMPCPAEDGSVPTLQAGALWPWPTVSPEKFQAHHRGGAHGQLPSTAVSGGAA